MRNPVLVLLSLFINIGCGAAAPHGPSTAGLGDTVHTPGDAKKVPEARAEPREGVTADEGSTSRSTSSETSDWWKVAPSEADDTPRPPPRRMGRIAVNSDPAKHGDALRLRFTVNGTPISGVFQAPGGKNSTFSIPSGTVAFTVDECSWEEQGFPLAPGEEIALVCKQTKEGDCCEVAIPVEDAAVAKRDASSNKDDNLK